MFSSSHIHTSTDTLQTILNAVPNPIFLKNQDHQLILANDAFCELMGRSRDELLNHVEDHLPQEQLATFWRIDDRVLTTGQPNENEEVITDGSGALRVILTRKRLVQLPTAQGTRPFILGVISDITGIREAERHARYLAEHDTLTGLANRTQLSAHLTEAIAIDKSRNEVALLMLDLDSFKAVNDQHGHSTGDELLQVIAKRLASLVRTTDTVARFGGDEFCIVQTGVPQPDGAFALAERILSSVSKPIALGPLRLSITASIGMALYPEDGTAPDVLLQRADTALYTVKNNGRKSYLRYDHKSTTPPASQWDIETALRAALAADELSLAFQPLTAAIDGKIRGFEALARWQHPTRGPIAPEVFIPAAESAGLIQQLGAWALHKACSTAASWPELWQVCVNVSPTQLENSDLPTVVKNALESSGLSPSRLQLEVTEAALLGRTDKTLNAFKELKALGVSLALDDFGAGWSSLATLQKFQFDRIKIDRSFIAGIGSDARSVAIVRAVLSLAQSLDVPVTAEGVERPDQLAALRQMGCAELQGFYIGSPSSEATLPNTKG